VKLSDYVWDRIAAEGVEHVFMIPGGGCMHLVDSLGRHPRLTFVSNLHEQGVAVAVDAYAQVRGFGAGLVTTGPGGTNALTGVAAAWLDSTPCIMISGQVKRADLKRNSGVRQLGFQEIDIVAMAGPITKYAVTIEDPLTVAWHLDRAIHLARSGRPGPVWIDIPLDVQASDIDPATIARWTPEPVVPPSLEPAARQMLASLATAQRPALLLGNGVRLAGALSSALELVDRLGIPVLTSWKAADFLPEAHPLFAGRPGAAGQRAANFTQQNADWLLAIGARLDHGQIAYRPDLFARAARKYVVDVDPAELNKLSAMKLELAITADAGAFVRALLAALPGRPAPAIASWLEQVQEWKRRYPVILPAYWEEQGYVDAYALVDALSAQLGEGDLLVPGSSGQCSELTHQAVKIRPGVRMFNSEGLGPMGFGVPAALGACVAAGNRRTVCVDGDGGFQMNVQELEVVRRLALPIKYFVLDNQGYGSIRTTQRGYFQRLVGSDATSGLTLPDVCAIATAYGIASARMESNADLRTKLPGMLAAPGPLVCSVRTNPEQQTLPRAVSSRRSDGTMTTKPMEDLIPFLDRDELRANLFIPEAE
jgi:acetolactate synthase-1/2/3 large subunit